MSVGGFRRRRFAGESHRRRAHILLRVERRDQRHGLARAVGGDRQRVFHPGVILVAGHLHVQPFHAAVFAEFRRGQMTGLDLFQRNLLVRLDQKHIPIRQRAHADVTHRRHRAPQIELGRRRLGGRQPGREHQRSRVAGQRDVPDPVLRALAVLGHDVNHDAGDRGCSAAG